MDKPLFTPGPWEVETEYMAEPGYEQFIKCQRIVTPVEEGENGDLVRYTVANINWCNPVEANAHLIAAAPDMYEALVDSIEAMEYALKYVEGLALGVEQDLRWVITSARQALAKARGEGGQEP